MNSYKKSQSWVYCIVLSVFLHISVLSAPAAEISINPTDVRGILGNMWDPFLLNFLAIAMFEDRTVEDRTVLEFDVSGLGGTLPLVTLDVSYVNSDPSPPDGIIDVFTFIGDGVVTADEFYAGGPTPFTSFVGGGVFASVDVTSSVQAAVDAGDRFIGFRLSTETGDRYLLGSIVGKPVPVLTVIPEPATILLLGLGSLIVRKLRFQKRVRMLNAG
jgi:hypothetical protein